MATNTPILGLRKPSGTDLVNVTSDISDNMDKLDAASNKVLGYAQSFANQLIPNGAITPFTGLTATVTVGTNRYIKLTGQVLLLNTHIGAQTLQGLTQDNGVNSGYFGFTSLVNNYYGLISGVAIIVAPVAGVHTFRLLGQSDGGPYSAFLGAVGFILVEDIGSTV